MRRLASLAAPAVAVLVAACGAAVGPGSSNFSELSGSGTLQMLNPQDGWTYSRDMVARTSDGARTFDVVTPPGVGGDGQVADPFFLDAAHAWVWVIRWNQSVLASATLERTADGGASWTVMPRQAVLEGGMTFVDLQHGWMITGRESGNHTAVENTLWRTSDGGATWSQLIRVTHRISIEPKVQVGDCEWLGQIAWTSTIHGVAGVDCPFDAPPAVEITDDGGSTWRQVSLPDLPPRDGIGLFEDVGDVHVFAGGGLAAFVSRCVGPDGNSCQPYGELYRSDDAGVTWTPGSVILRGGGLLMPDADHAWMPNSCLSEQCDSAQILVTADGGAHWQQLPLPQALWPNMHGSRSYSFVSSTVGFVVVSNEFQTGSSFYQTTDGGHTFVAFTPRFLPPKATRRV
ncbi:MAG TPA: hypothetical protein VFO75_03850 [Candidatus Dormibacteraeota bacterium]|nr:hypothetical protein [Candidatus Dormibacteraeota bacterium]